MRRPTLRPAHVPVPLLVVALASVAIGARASSHGPYRIVPGPYERKAADPAAAPQPSRFTIRGLTVEVTYLDPPARASFVRSLAGSETDPFSVAPGRPEAYTTFRVEFDNRSGEAVTFQPGNVLLITDRRDQQFPIDLTDLYRLALRSGVDDPQSMMERAAPLIFDSSTTIPSGARVSRLLVFGALPEKWKEFRLHVSFLQIGSETHTLSFAFHKWFEKP
ncbi:MAG TPA: hypothetical protein VNL37_08715 [Candidatus Polarisedimenticolia bacterium]|nr:hypothetical protein [Candidatus Polarisedimenticolia bacterium]